MYIETALSRLNSLHQDVRCDERVSFPTTYKPSIFRRFIKWIKGKFKKHFSVELYVMTVDEPSKYTGRTYSKELIQRELDSRPDDMPFLAHFGREAKYATLTGFTRDYPIFEQDFRTIIGTVDSFRFEGNRLMATMTGGTESDGHSGANGSASTT